MYLYFGEKCIWPNPGEVNISFRWIDCLGDVIWDYDVSKNAGQL